MAMFSLVIHAFLPPSVSRSSLSPWRRYRVSTLKTFHRAQLTLAVTVKHQGKKYNVDLDPTANGEMLNYQLFSLTGVEPDRQSLLIKGGKLKDDTDLSKLGVKPNQLFTLIGTASSDGAAVVAPTEKPKFLEDMTEAEAAQMGGATPAGLQNLGNTCYLNSTLQVLKRMPEMQEELSLYKPDAAAGGSSLQSLSQHQSLLHLAPPMLQLHSTLLARHQDELELESDTDQTQKNCPYVRLD